MTILEIRNISKAYNGTQALRDVSLEVARGETVALLGPSGSGKSTLLNIVAGLETPDAGDVRWDGESILETPVHRRGFGFVFQDYLLFPHMRVADNVAFGLRMAGRPQPEIEQRVGEVLALVGLPGFQERDVTTLSGGEKQRVALARSLAPAPRLLLLDEPLGALDRLLRERLALDLHHILEQTQQTALYVTHDQEEAFLIAGRVALLQAGELVQAGRPQELYRQPRNEFVARFLGLENILEAELQRADGGARLVSPLGTWDLPAGHTLLQDSREEGRVSLLLRPDRVQINRGDGCRLEGVLRERIFQGEQQRVVVDSHGQRLAFNLPSHVELPEPGARVEVCFDPLEALQVLGA